MKNKTVIYTSIINPKEPFGIYENYDRLKEPRFVEEGIDYICYTNNPRMKSNTFKFVYTPLKFGSAIRTSREMKILPHKYLSEYDVSVYIDGSTMIDRNITDFVKKKIQNCNFAARKHDKRSCVYDEANHIINIFDKNPKDKPEIIRKHIETYKKQDYPQNNGLFATGVLIRRHNDLKLIKCMEQWWNMYMTGCRRDQLSLPYALWKTNCKIENFITQKEYEKIFTHIGHRIKYGKVRNT